MVESQPAPLVPAEVDLRDFAFMPLEVARLRRSKSWLIAKRLPEVGFYMLNLWSASWHDLPAGSLEDDDDVLADLAMCSPKRWAKVRANALHGWVKCSDGRLYHPVVAEKVLDAWAAKQAQRQRTSAARNAREQKRLQEQSQKLLTDQTVSVTKSVTENVTASKGEGQGEREGDSIPPNGGGDTAPRSDLLGDPPPVEAEDAKLYRLGREVLGKNAGGVVRKLLAARGGSIPQAMAALQAAAERHDAMAYIQGCIRPSAGASTPSDSDPFGYGAPRDLDDDLERRLMGDRG